MHVLEIQIAKSAGLFYNLPLQKKVVGFGFSCHDPEIKCLQTQNIGKKTFWKVHKLNEKV